MKFKLIYILVLTTILSSCGQNSKTNNGDGTSGTIKSKIFNPKDDLVGEFAIEQNGTAELKVTKQNGDYFIQLFEKGNWSNPEKLGNVNDSDFEELFGVNWRDNIEAGLNAEAFFIFKVKKGSKVKGLYDKNEYHTFSTGYFFYFLISGDIYKLN
jgi:hypothetical protein